MVKWWYRKVNIILSGRVLVQVYLKNGEIERGDYLVLPKIESGKLMKVCGLKYCEVGLFSGNVLEKSN